MTVSGFELPVAFVELCEAIERGEAPYEWELKENVDAYGRPWEIADLRIVAHDPESLESWTAWIQTAFFQEGRLSQPSYEADAPGFIADFTDLSHFVWLGDSTAGHTYAFDFGTDPKEPSVVCWDNYWRRVAPDFASFIALFIDTYCAPYWDEESEERAPSPPCEILACQARWYVLASRESVRRLFADVGEYYAACSAEERREAEAEVREELEKQGMTDDQRRRLGELWERLRATHPA
jgi:hypothetical protein